MRSEDVDLVRPAITGKRISKACPEHRTGGSWQATTAVTPSSFSRADQVGGAAWLAGSGAYSGDIPPIEPRCASATTSSLLLQARAMVRPMPT
jgi:hypothetical protein